MVSRHSSQSHHRHAHSPLLHNQGHGDFPASVRHFEVRKDQHGVPVSRGYLYPKLHGTIGKADPSTDVFTRSPGRVPYSQLLSGLQCANHEPDLDSASGLLHILRMAPPSQETLELVCAYVETRCEKRAECQSNVDDFKAGRFPEIFGQYRFSGFQQLSLFRVKGNELYIDWPWGRGRMKEYRDQKNNGSHLAREDSSLWETVNNRLLRNTLKILHVNDSMFMMGGEEAWLPWLTPFPSFATAPKVTTAEMPWPWAEAYTSAQLLYDRAVSSNGECV